MASEWFYQATEEQVGPISSAELRSLAQQGAVKPDTPVRKAPDGAWVPAERVQGLFAVPAPTPPPSGDDAVAPSEISTARNVSNPTPPPMPVRATVETKTVDSSSPPKRIVARRFWLIVGLACTLLLGITAILAGVTLLRGFGGKHQDSAAKAIEAKFDPQDVDKTKKWLGKLTKQYMQVVREENTFRTANAKAAVRQKIEEIPTGTAISWTTTVLSVQPKEIWVFITGDIHMQFYMRISPDDTPDYYNEHIPIGKCIDFDTVQSIKCHDKLAVTGKLVKLTVDFWDADEPTEAFVVYDAVIVNVRVKPLK